MRTTTACTWCHTLNDAEQRDCLGCGHDAHAPRSQCRCQACGARTVHMANGSVIKFVADGSERLAGVKPARPAADKINHVALGLSLQYVIYYGLKNWPEQYALRCFDVHDGPMMMPVTAPMIVHADLAKVRALVPSGYVNVGRNGKDAACVVEIWV
jgi:hypothetical protein